MNKWISLVASAVLMTSITGCNSSDGKNGTNGEAGIKGTDGKDGITSVSYNRYENNAVASKVEFEHIAVPTGDAQKTIHTSSLVSTKDDLKSVNFTKLLATGSLNNSETFGLLKDYQDNAISFSDGSPYICNGTNSGVGSGLDYTSILQKNNKLYMVSQFECQIGAIYKAELEQNPSSGTLTVKENSLEFISQKAGFGGYVHCAGQKTPWESHLGSEEYEPNARSVENDANSTTGLTGNKYYDELAKYWDNDISKASPYYYGWTPEIKIDTNGLAVYTKHYAMGRMSHELSYVMPDKKTVYMSDDGTNVGLFMFVADEAQDLSSGTLYAAKWIQKDASNGASADLSWIKLADSDDASIKAILDPDGNVNTNDAPKFSDIFDVAQTNEDNTCPSGFTSVNTSAYQECLKVKTGKETAAAYLETRRYAALKGATTEFRKEEGITFSAEHGKLFVAMSAIAYGMEDNMKKGSENTKYDLGGHNDIKIPYNPCGAVYALDVASNTQIDMAGDDIQSAYVVNNMYAILTGEPITYPQGHPYEGNTCSVNGISNPDNLTYLDGSDLLFIGEDTSSHLNNMVWAYDLNNGKMTRTLTTPLDAETTSPFWYKNINGFSYMTAVTQHPMEDVEGASNNEKESFVGVMSVKGLNASNTALTKVGSFNTNKSGASEISAFDSASNKVFITNGADNTLDILDLSIVNAPVKLSSIDLSTYGASIQSVDTKSNKVALAVGSANKTTTKGKVVIFNTDGTFDKEVIVGYLPDMVTFNEDGSKIIVANEGEPDASSGTYVDVAGTVGIITVATGAYNEVGFVDGDLNNANDGTVVRKGGTPSNATSLDMEPEYIAIVGNKAYVTLQENNAIATIDISTATPSVDGVKSLGVKDYSSENKIDIEEEGKILLKNYPGLKAMYQPDTIVSQNIAGTDYLFTANEGDGREYLDSNEDDVFADEKKISKLTLDASISDAYAKENDLKVMTDISTSTQLYTFGARSFSIWDTNGDLVWDSGDAISKLVAKYEPNLFNQDDAEIDGRSGNKGSEPESIAVGQLSNSKVYAFVGLERQSAIVIYDVSNPSSPEFVDYIATHTDNDISPEGMKFIPASKSPNAKDLLLVSYEISGSTVIYEVK